MGRVAAIPTSVLTFLFSYCGTHVMIHSFSFFKCSSAMARYRVIHSSFALYSCWICLTISQESNLISNLVAANIRARSSPASTTSYSASLLEVEKLIWIACSISSLVGDCKTRPTLDLNTLDTPSTWSVYHCFPGWSVACVCFLGSSAIKSAITWFFKDNHY